MMEFLYDMWKYFKARKKFWLLPLVIVLLLLGILLIVGGNSALAPFIYTLF
jgi:competence protein ComGC